MWIDGKLRIKRALLWPFRNLTNNNSNIKPGLFGQKIPRMSCPCTTKPVTLTQPEEATLTVMGLRCDKENVRLNLKANLNCCNLRKSQIHPK